MTLKRKTHAKRGALLAVAIIIFPIAAGFLLLTLTRSEMALSRTRLDIARAQSRLLAESAIVVYLNQDQKQKPGGGADADSAQENGGKIRVSGQLEGVGSYTLIVVEEGSPDGGRRLEAIGVAKDAAREIKTIITAEQPTETPRSLRFLTRETRIETREAF